MVNCRILTCLVVKSGVKSWVSFIGERVDLRSTRNRDAIWGYEDLHRNPSHKVSTVMEDYMKVDDGVVVRHEVLEKG